MKAETLALLLSSVWAIQQADFIQNTMNYIGTLGAKMNNMDALRLHKQRGEGAADTEMLMLTEDDPGQSVASETSKYALD